MPAPYGFFVFIYKDIKHETTFISIAILLCGICSTKAIPADPTPKKVIQPDGTSLTVLMRGDEHRHLLFTEDGYPLFSTLRPKPMNMPDSTAAR